MRYLGPMFDLLVEIISNHRVTDDTWLMAMRSVEIARTTRPGQFVMIRVSPGLDPLLRRPFSLCGVKDDQLLVLYRIVGKGTKRMTELRTGEGIRVLGPLGKAFHVSGKNTRPLLVGGGIGIAPLLFLDQVHREKNVTFLAGFRSAKDVLYPEKITGEERGFGVATDDGTQGHHGPVTDLLEERLHEDLRDVTVFACGPKPMLRKIAHMTMTLRIPCQVSLESHMACGLGACQGCAVKASPNSERSYCYVCKEGPVFEAEEIDWEAF
jgi:dihydroorotate dehydrogenase electron transfer subunit